MTQTGLLIFSTSLRKYIKNWKQKNQKKAMKLKRNSLRAHISAKR